MTRAAGAGAVALLAVLLPAFLSGCTVDGAGAAKPSASSSTDAAPHGPAIRVVSPEGAVHLGDEVRVVIRATDDGAPLATRDATFEVVSGPATYPGGFETSATDSDGVASSLGLHPDGPGRVTIRVAVGTISSDLTIEVAAS
ncbi:MAG: hypothetical protein B7X41_12030 [Microbacterium sp. 14-71-5]|uniref:hypothetical protein n=1 Tax=Microbacterium sp. 13-71-7 TaxID=1970399 RepID=UPI000BD338FA|nr:hypothetical protein [Microbacterium sp. 13-71-7]OZB86092.1 MAG: hypothetical protein B7X32_00790 [Microbacterium sp. 13-71-7]OZB87705.1 MAG: hypothetical protein B7X41_12030 [Microbacterium sp. 14-71-5]